MALTAQPDPIYGAMQDWMARWTELEAQLAALLSAPRQYADFLPRLERLRADAEALLDTDEDATLYWLFQLAASTSVGYSTSHAMACWAMCRLVGPAVGVSAPDAAALERAALTMNIGMTRLQDTLAAQAHPPTEEQRTLIDTHAARGAQCLRECGVRDARWLDIVELHHEADSHDTAVRLLQRMDRYTALISPRETRPGRNLTDSARTLLVQPGGRLDDIGRALLQTLGICPPGTFVRLADGQVAVVLRRSGRPGEPWVSAVLDADGHPVLEPALIDTGDEATAIEAALQTATVRVRLNHPRLLQLSRLALQR
ncbi:HD-GYP domain-containing protein [Tepidimonas sp.]|uniref:HD-GYP domain-containing protein n=1 Tax=Tepidimonas sp. TaxID=2002775 RepID=UPI00391D2B18